MPAAPFGEGLVARDCDPPGKGSSREETVPVTKDAEHACGVEVRSADFGPADRGTIQLFFAVDRKHSRIRVAALDAPMKHRVGVEYLQATHQQQRDAEH